MRLFLDVFDQLNRHEVKYVVVGGLAVVLHGHARLTMDVDLVVRLDETNARAAITALLGMGYRPRAPVDAMDFVSQEARNDWARNRNMLVFSLCTPDNPFNSVDLFVEPPIPFDRLYERSEIHQVDETPIRVCSIEDLIEMKRLSGRPADLNDIEALERLTQ